MVHSLIDEEQNEPVLKELSNRTYFKPNTTRRILNYIIDMAQKEILDMKPLWLHDRNVLLLPNLKSSVTKLNGEYVLIPLYKKIFTLKDNDFLQKCAEHIKSKETINKDIYSVRNLKQFIDLYFEIINERSNNNYRVGIKGLVTSSNNLTSDKKDFFKLSNDFKCEGKLQFTLYNTITKRNSTKEFDKKDWIVTVKQTNPANILI